MRIKNKLFFFLFFLFQFTLRGQTPQVPDVIHFADMTLQLNSQARREIQLDVDALYRNSSYFQIKLDRVNLYMPTIERVLREQGVPQDLKYLVIQESSLIPDAVSTSNAVGFWQFKKGTAEEVFLRVDNQIDERKNIVSATRGAALYLKKHQNHLDNWACALVSYQMGLGGARRYFGDKYKGKRGLVIDRNTHWYLKKFLAHKIAFEGQLGKTVSNGDFLHEYRVTGPTDLAALSRELGVTESHLREMNKWTSNGRIPGDRQYTVTYVQKGFTPQRPVLAANDQPNPYNHQTPSGPTEQFPKVTGNRNLEDQPGQIEVNGIQGVLATNTTSLEAFASKTGINERRIRRVNDLKKSEKIIAGNYYYTRRKKGKAQIDEHVVRPGETLWEVSQTYGIRLNSLKAKNRIYNDADLRPGMVLKLRDYRKRNEDIKIVSPPVVRTATVQKVEQAPERVQTVSAASPAHSAYGTPVTSQNEAISHSVKPGETLYAISRQYQVSVEDLRSWNNLNTESILSIGQVIVIKK